ncbi:MAG: flagellar basal-body rod protein FlgF [Aquabacterium sp.]|uniref:flagellar basal-body rod protein FlgF n=1 Tax=Aquabacterium sp. TaxID=1872578 RepID=UPI0027250CBC|nr:flagellar basal-body rod protein FlgF [Aquabacterium sp.]MDO9005732.1 flagellar basal-body rod protein FlgF [Aquabacterium sp.]
MIDSIHVASSGLSGHQKGLKVISNNVANLNTPGYKGSQAQFTDVFLSQGGDASTGESTTPGGGLDTLNPTVNFSTGDIRETGRDLDMALDGPGFFVVRNDQGQTLYTKSGRFEFNSDGQLVTMDKGMAVMGLSGGGGRTLSAIDIGQLKNSAPKATTTVTLKNNLSSTAVFNDPLSIATIEATTVYDHLGGNHVLKMVFTPTAISGTWTLNVTEKGISVGSGTVKTLGAFPDPTADRISVTIRAADNTASFVNIVLGNQVTGNSGGTSSQIAMDKVDGNTAGTITKTAFDDTGTLVITYSNTLTAKGPQIAIAEFVSPEVLTAVSGSLFKYTGADPVRVVAAGNTTKLTGGSLELSNVDLTDQFSAMILIQRGFQASSQVLSTASDMIQALYDMKSRR